MSKAAAIAATGVGGGGAAFGGYLIFNNSGGGSGEKGEATTTDAKTPEEVPTLVFKDLEAFKKESSKDVCFQKILGNETLNLTSTDGAAGTVPTDGFGNAASETENIKGCLAINYEKTKGEGGKLTGTFTWTWIFLNKDKGFINFNVAKSADNNQLQLTGGFYLIEKDTAQNASGWKIKWKEEVTTAKTVAVSDTESKFPKVKANSGVSVNNENYWGFVEDSGVLKDMADNSKTVELKEWSWKWESADAQNKMGIGEWSNDLKWWDNLYESSKGLNLSEKLTSFKGTWTEQTKPQPS